MWAMVVRRQVFFFYLKPPRQSNHALNPGKKCRRRFKNSEHMHRQRSAIEIICGRITMNTLGILVYTSEAEKSFYPSSKYFNTGPGHTSMIQQNLQQSLEARISQSQPISPTPSWTFRFISCVRPKPFSHMRWQWITVPEDVYQNREERTEISIQISDTTATFPFPPNFTRLMDIRTIFTASSTLCFCEDAELTTEHIPGV